MFTNVKDIQPPLLEFLKKAIKEAELNTSGEIRLHIENKLEGTLFSRTYEVFRSLDMDKTELQNGVLFYVALTSKKFAIIGDKGINDVVPTDFWDEIKNHEILSIQRNDMINGLAEGIRMAGEALKKEFPYQTDDVNELSDEISINDN